ncbi:MAG: hypothetical protein REI11_18680, partial [Patulibacter sp.]|nr:hypothetical protein [Patulibacter sp.]
MLDLLHAWILYVAVLGLLVYGLGLLVEKASGRRLPGVLLLPLGLLTLIFVATVVTVVPSFAPATTPIAALLALLGLALGGRLRRPPLGASLLLAAVLLVYGAPVILSGQATFAGYIRLDDTASWLTLSDQLLAHGRSLADVPDSSFRQLLAVSESLGYPPGAFPPLGISSKLSGIDAAWAFAPYVSFCGAMVAAALWVLVDSLGLTRRVRWVVVFAAAQPALLFGYVQWGGIKEITIAFGLIVLLLLALQAIGGERPGGWRSWIPLAVASGSMLSVAGTGGVAFVGPVLAGVGLTWIFRAWRHRWIREVIRPMAVLAGLTVLVAVPTVIELGTLSFGKEYLTKSSDYATRFGNLRGAVRGWQLGGVWFSRDFRDPAGGPTGVLLVVVALSAIGGLVVAVRRRVSGMPVYVALGLLGAVAGVVSTASPWLMGKTLAIASPAVPLAALCGAAFLAMRWRAGWIVVLVLVGGIVGSNVSQYTDVTLAPRDRFEELQHIGQLVKGHGPTFDNEYEVYATRHFLRDGAPIQPAELRTAPLPLSDGRFLIKSASADIDGFPPSTLAPYNALVVQRTPTMSVPSSQWKLAWQGRFYALYFRTNVGTLIKHVPLGDSRTLPYCGNSQNSTPLALCSVQPIQTPTCRVIDRLGKQAAAAGASLVAQVRP